MGPGFLRAVASRIGDLGAGRFAFLTAAESEGGALSFIVLLGGAADRPAVELGEAGKRVADLLEGRGGGVHGVFQGRAGSFARRSEAVAALRDLLGGPGTRLHS